LWTSGSGDRTTKERRWKKKIKKFSVLYNTVTEGEWEKEGKKKSKTYICTCMWMCMEKNLTGSGIASQNLSY
jgi:hypothetical protein